MSAYSPLQPVGYWMQSASSTLGDNTMYIIFYWDAYGDPHQTERMTKEQADIVVATMTLFGQDPYLVYVR
jgi:hypothetical protein